MLPQASQLSTLNLCTNPYCCDVDGVRVLGTSGQPLDDMQRSASERARNPPTTRLRHAPSPRAYEPRTRATHRYLPGDERMQTLQRSLEFQHLAPTAPDTLGCYPFAEKSSDPFVMSECPHIYFAGNQPRFESTLVQGPAGQRTRAIMVPDFQLEHTCVLVNLETLECRPMSFAGLDSVADMQH